MKIVVTGGAGFIGSALVRYLIENTEHLVLNVDKLTYAGNLDSLASISENRRYTFVHADICNRPKVESLFFEFQPDLVIHLAAESHVDRSIEGPKAFIETNVMGTFNLLEASRHYWNKLSGTQKDTFRFHHVSTDEVYGDLDDNGALFTETTPYAPSSPYSASKASSDHLVRAWQRTYGIPVILTNCSNNYGPYHFPEKFIPHVILNALEGKKIPVYGNGRQIRDWLYVEDHVAGLYAAATRGQIGDSYNIGGKNEKQNIQVVDQICKILEDLAPERKKTSNYSDLITFVEDRPGHDKRYAIDTSKIERELGWAPTQTFETGLKKTVQWYLKNENWWRRILNGEYRLERLGGTQ